MKKEFKPADFQDIGYVSLPNMAKLANKLLPEIKEAWKAELLKDAVVVYGLKDPETYWKNQNDRNLAEVKALLIQVEPIVKEPCLHEPPLKVYDWKNMEHKCIHCDVELVAEWKEKA